MPDRAGRDEFHQAVEGLTPGELLKLKNSAAWRVRGLGRSACGRTWEDLLSEAYLSILEGTANNGSGRCWNKNVDLVTVLGGAMRSIASHWKRDFVEEEAALESELATRSGENDWISPLENAASDDPCQERYVAACEEWDLIAALFNGDVAARGVLEGWSREMTPREVMKVLDLTEWKYEQAVRRIRLRLRKRYKNLRSK